MNVDWLYHLPAPCRRGLYFGLQRAIGSRVAEAWRDFQSWAGLAPAVLEQRIEQRLSRTLNQAVGHSAYYRELNLTRRPGETAAEFLRRFPVLKRETVRERFQELVADPWRGQITSPQSVSSRRYDWLVVTTGGTTGCPTAVVSDPRSRDWGRATRLFSARLCGHPLGTRFFRLWGSETELLHTQASLALRAQQALLGYIPMNAFRSLEIDLKRHYETIRQHPEIDSMMAYVDAAVILARFIQEKELPPVRLRTIMACAGTVTPEWRQVLQETFGAEVFDKYGSRECCDLACECAQHDGLHVYAPNAFLEVVDDAGAACPPEVTGRILVTLLNNTIFPMVRYEIGDLAQWAKPGACRCGLAWPRLRSLQGRADDLLLTENGTWITSVFVRHFVGVSLNRQLIREWQLEQVEPRKFIFRFVPLREEGLSENVAAIANAFHLALGRNMSFQPERVSAIPLSPSGKMRWIINRLRRDRSA
jgi:phenylacetate-CoA ligase